ncbi:MAG: response regulator transcription factor [Candidatus Nanopelagicus sp.]|jgi:DNA-binding NarL/FixJ family response regulator|nr:response regulator transcription factor [Candidatus Nanopelagicus sp.]
MLQTQSGQLKLLIVEDDKILLTMMSGALTSEGFNVLAASDAQSAMQYFDKARPDVVILDIDLGAGPSGIDLANKMRQISGRIAIVFCTSFKDMRFIQGDYLKYPLHTVVLKKADVVNMEKFSNAINEAVELIRESDESKPDNLHEKYYKDLTALEIELLTLIAGGHSNKQVAAEKGISLKSCENAIARLAKKLEIPAAEQSNQRVLLTRKYMELSGKSSSD